MYFGPHLVTWLLMDAQRWIDWREIDGIVAVEDAFPSAHGGGGLSQPALPKQPDSVFDWCDVGVVC